MKRTRSGLLRLLSVLVTTLLLGAAVTRAVINEGENGTDAAVKKNPAMVPVIDEPGLPRVLLVGDSISIGYTVPVRERLKGKANVHRIPENGGTTVNGLKKLDKWLGDGKWDVIHFNFGLHDAKYLTPDKTKVDEANYEKNLREMVRRFQATGAKVIFATTTPVPADLEPPTRRIADVTVYNQIALRVMDENHVAIDDLYTLVLPKLAEIQRPHDVHYLPAGYQLIADQVTASIEKELPAK